MVQGACVSYVCCGSKLFPNQQLKKPQTLRHPFKPVTLDCAWLCPSGGHSALCGDTQGTVLLVPAEAPDAAAHPTTHTIASSAKNDLAPNVASVTVERTQPSRVTRWEVALPMAAGGAPGRGSPACGTAWSDSNPATPAEISHPPTPVSQAESCPQIRMLNSQLRLQTTFGEGTFKEAIKLK